MRKMRSKKLCFILMLIFILSIVNITASAVANSTGNVSFSVNWWNTSRWSKPLITVAVTGETVEFGVNNHTGDAIYCRLIYSKYSDGMYPVDKGAFVVSSGVSSGYNTRTVGNDLAYYPPGYYWVQVERYNGGSASGTMYCSVY